MFNNLYDVATKIEKLAQVEKLMLLQQIELKEDAFDAKEQWPWPPVLMEKLPHGLIEDEV